MKHETIDAKTRELYQMNMAAYELKLYGKPMYETYQFLIESYCIRKNHDLLDTVYNRLKKYENEFIPNGKEKK